MRILKIVGDSMAPQYSSGDFVLVGRYRRRTPRRGDDVVFTHRDYGVLLKRIEAVGENGLRVRGLNTLSADAGLGPLRESDWPTLERVLLHVPRSRRSLETRSGIR